jgi:crotonobetaine/carnitine-CoA ligase
VTWLELHEESLRWAAALRRVGVGPGEYVLTMLPNGPAGCLGWLGPAYLGAIDVSINHANRGSSLCHVLDNTRATTAIVHERFWPQWQPELAGSSVRTVVVVGDGPAPASTVSLENFLDGAPPIVRPHQAHELDISCVIYTSGTTGPSKGVLLAWRKWDAAYFSGYLPMRYRTADHVGYSTVGLFHLTARLPIYEAARQGSRMVTRDGFKTEHWLDDIRAHEVTGTIAVGAMGPFIHRSPARPDDADTDLQYVSMAPIFSGIDDFKRRFGVRVYSAYSMTELPFMFAVGDAYEMTEETRHTCGLPTQGPWEHRLVDDDGQDVPAGKSGELWVRGALGVMNEGYLNMPEATATAWDGGWFHTGDMLRFDERGRYYFVDRKKDCLRRRGENISSIEVEREINAHPDVLESAVYGVRSDYEEDEVMAAVVLRPGASVTAAALVEFVRPRLPSFAVPRYVDLVSALPRTPTERVQKNVLRETGVTALTWDAGAGR